MINMVTKKDAHFSKLVLITVFVGILNGCILRTGFIPADQSLDVPLADTAQVKLIIFNDSNVFMYSADESDKINIQIDEQEVGNLKIGQYIMLPLKPGTHRVKLSHRDIGNFKSEHSISIFKSINYLKIYSKITSNGADIIDLKPSNFDKKYTVMRRPKNSNISVPGLTEVTK